MVTPPSRFVRWLGACAPTILASLKKGTGVLVTLAEKLDMALAADTAATFARQALAAPADLAGQAAQSAEVLYQGESAVLLAQKIVYTNFRGRIYRSTIAYRVDDPTELASLEKIKADLDKVDPPAPRIH